MLGKTWKAGEGHKRKLVCIYSQSNQNMRWHLSLSNIPFFVRCTIWEGVRWDFWMGCPVFLRDLVHMSSTICTKYITTRYITQSKAQCFSCCLLQPHPAALPSGLNISQFGPYSNTARQRPASMHPPSASWGNDDDDGRYIFSLVLLYQQLARRAAQFLSQMRLEVLRFVQQYRGLKAADHPASQSVQCKVLRKKTHVVTLHQIYIHTHSISLSRK